MEFLSSIVFHTVLFIPCNMYVLCQNVDAPTIYRGTIYGVSIIVIYKDALSTFLENS